MVLTIFFSIIIENIENMKSSQIKFYLNNKYY